MYWRRFNLTGEPFSLTPDPAFLYLSSIHAEAYAALTMGLRERRGLISMIGEVGTGKTTLVYSLLSTIGPEVHTAYISNARLSFDGILRNALRDFGVRCDNLHGVDLLDAFNEFLQLCAKQGTTAALVIDEAQNLSHDTFEDLRLLSNFETYKHKLLQIVLVGQPELDSKLRDPALRQVAERIGVRCHVNPLTPQETRRYIEHRLSAVGGTSDVFTETALRTIISRSAGIPRAVNILCHNAMLFAYGQAKAKVTRAMVLEAVHEKEGAGLVRTDRSSSRLAYRNGLAGDSAAWAWNAALLILAVGVSIALIRAAGNIRFTPPALEPVASPRLPASATAPAEAPAQPVTASASRPLPPPVLEEPPQPLGHQPEPLPLAGIASRALPQEPAADVKPTAPVTAADVKPTAPVTAADEPGRGLAPTAGATPAASGKTTKAADNVEPAARTAAAAPTPQPSVAAPNPTRPLDRPHVASKELNAAERLTSVEPPPAMPAGAVLPETTSAAPPRVDVQREQRPEPASYKVVDVEPGNSLSDLMIAVYGQYTNNMVRRVQAMNPQITDPNMILAGDSLRFPAETNPTFASEEQSR
jgi:type II secretory pathway predicted ATPase ExeA